MRQDYQTLKDQNPFVVLRNIRGVTQEVLAGLLGVNTHYVYRMENGLVNTISPAHVRTIIAGLSENNIDQRVLNILDEYEDWVQAMRAFIKALNINYNKLLYGPYQDVNHLRDIHPFIVFEFNFNVVVGGLLDIDLNPLSKQLFNRYLCIHPRAQELYLYGNGHLISGVLSRALVEVGVDEDTITKLEQQVKLYLDRHARG